MAQITSKSTRHTEKVAVAKTRQTAAKPWVQRLERFGFLVRGAIYIVIGLLALQLAIGAGGSASGPTSAIAMIGRLPFGKFLLALIAVGLAGYALWGFVRAFLDPLGRGSDTKGLIDRMGFLISGISYGALVVPTVQEVLNKPGGLAQGSSTGVPAALMAGPWGKWFVIGLGLFWVGAGIGQLVSAYTTHFMRDLRTNTMSVQEIKTARDLGKAGYAARGVVFGLIGMLILQPSLAGGGAPSQGFDGALAALAAAPNGEILLGLVAVGLVLFGIYSALCAKWNKIGNTRRSR